MTSNLEVANKGESWKGSGKYVSNMKQRKAFQIIRSEWWENSERNHMC